MRGDPSKIDASCREQERAAASKFEAERESYRAEAEADAKADERKALERNTISLRELAIRQSGTPWISPRQAFIEGIVSERVRILDDIARLEQETAALWFEGSAVTRAVAAYTKAVRGIVEGKA